MKSNRDLRIIRADAHTEDAALGATGKICVQGHNNKLDSTG